ncbi:MAG: sigma-54-dependent Fis family transcriptional regulator [Myxococcales bacterium]|nr:sigma-54-dependent Fis family transcriptional regulator [Myxococcales bacterium]
MVRPDTNPRDYLVAESPAMRAVVATIERMADSDGPVLVCGEHGTGRELVARVLHVASPRRAGRFVAVRPTFESAGGGDTGDDGERARRVLRAAQGGTLLVKDVCDVQASGQRALRRAIRAPERERRPDSSGEVFDVRVVGSADLDLERAVAAKMLTTELYEPMAARRIDVPPLRDRGGDIPTLVERWVRRYGDDTGRGKLTVSTRAHERLVKYPWPGNVAELKNLCRRLVLRTTGSRIEAGDVDAVLPVVAERVPMEDLSFEEVVQAKLSGFLQRMDGYPLHDLYDKVVERVERPLFALVLEKTGGNQLKAAEILGLNRNTLRKKLDALGVARRGKGREDRALDD